MTHRIVCGDFIALLPWFPKAFVDLLILDLPSNLTQRFGAENSCECRLPSPRDPVVLAVVAGAAPEGAVLVVEVDRGDGAGVLLHEVERVAHPLEFAADPGGDFLRERDAARLGVVLANELRIW